MLFPDMSEAFINLVWAISTIYVVVTWMMRLAIYKKGRRFAAQYPLEIAWTGSAEPQEGALRTTHPWAPSREVQAARLGLLLIPCLWGPVVTFAIVFGADWRDGMTDTDHGYVLWACVVPILLTAWFCRRARQAFPELGRNIGKNWRISAVGTILTGALLAYLVGMTKSAEKVGLVSVACSYMVVGVTVLLGVLLWRTSAEIATTEKSLVLPHE